MDKKANLQLRAAVIQSIRAFFCSKGFLEVETPLRIPANAPEEHIEPFTSGNKYLQTSPEICMKRLLAAGYERIFQVCRCWRSGERGRWHLPEFTMLEWYRSNGDYNDLMDDCVELLRWLADEFGRNNQVASELLDTFTAPALKITVKEAFARFAAADLMKTVSEGSFDEVVVTRVEPALPKDSPVFLIDYPAEMAALARLKPEDDMFAERFEMYIKGLEIANGFSELNDSIEQKHRFLESNQKRVAAGLAALPLPAPFLDELAQMPVSAGIALGVDRLVMLIAGADKIDDVVTFTPEAL